MSARPEIDPHARLIAAEEPEYLDCDLCYPADGTEPYPYAHCCGCGADGGAQVPECICQ
ncbi:hypothetical protein [Streptomyces sp. NPDC088184]|uniref:hypothetical protein n=1 Tax=unclassified Streptomyces TaxID=2593676 RepID=UPI0034433009